MESTLKKLKRFGTESSYNMILEIKDPDLKLIIAKQLLKAFKDAESQGIPISEIDMAIEWELINHPVKNYPVKKNSSIELSSLKKTEWLIVSKEDEWELI